MTDSKNTATTFASLSLAASSLDNLTQLGYTQMTPIQAASLPLTLAGRDLIAQAAGRPPRLAFRWWRNLMPRSSMRKP